MQRHLLASVLSVLLTALLTSLVCADGKITTDPNTPGATTIKQTATQDEDIALDKKITYDGPDLDLTTMLSQVSKLSEVKFHTSSAKDNWQVRQRTAIVFANDAPLSELKNGLAKLFGYRWTHAEQTDGSRPYVLRELDAKKTARQDMIEAEKQARIEANRAEIKAAIDAANKATILTPDQIKDARENDPWLYYLAANPSGKKWSEVIRSIPQNWWELAAQGKGKTVRVAEAADPTEMKIIGLLDQIREMPLSGTAEYGYDTNSLSTYRADPLSQLILNNGMLIAFVKHTRPINGGKDVSWGDVQIENCPIGPSDSFQCRVAGNASILAEDGRTMEEAGQPALDKTCDHVNARNKDPQPDSMTDPALLKEIEHKPLADPKKKDEPSLITHLRGLAKETGYTMMVETFDNDRNVSPKDVWAPDKGTVFQILSDLTKTGRMTWEKSGNVVCFRYREWPKLRALEIDNKLIKRWEDAAKANGYLSFDDLYDIVSNVTYDQVMKTLPKNKLLNLAGIEQMTCGPYWAFLAAASMLPEDQRRLFLSDTGVPVRLFSQIDLASDPKAKELQGWTDPAVTKDQEQITGIYELPDQSGRKRVRYFTHYSDGRNVHLDWSLASGDDIKAVRDYVKSLEKAAIPQPPS